MDNLEQATPRRKGIHRPGKNNAPAATPRHVSRDAVWVGYRLALGRRANVIAASLARLVWAARMKSRKDKGRIEEPFVPMLIPTMKSAAWKAMSPYARVVYYTLKSRYGHKIRNNGRIYLSARDGADETGFNRNRIVRSLRELQHYGFIIMTEPGCLGVNGRGKAPHWRLTELGHMTDPPTRDFLKWDGELFHEQKSPEYYKRQERRLAKLRTGEKQNPVMTSGTDCHDRTDIPASRPRRQLSEKVSRPDGHING